MPSANVKDHKSIILIRGYFAISAYSLGTKLHIFLETTKQII